MALSNEQIKTLIKEPRARQQLLKAVKHEQRINFHAEQATEEADCGAYLSEYRQWVNGILPADKAAMFFKIMGFPLYTNELIKGISEEYMKVYDSQNSSFTYEFSNENTESEFKSFLRLTDFWSKWQDESAEAMLTGINSIMIVDLPREPGESADPYYYFLNIATIIDIGVMVDGSIAYLLATQQQNDKKQDRFLYIDESRYMILVKVASDEYQEEMSVPHSLGYCPATFFWKEPVTKRYPIVKRSPLTPALTNLNWLLFFETARRCLETYASYPILISFKEKCGYTEKIGDAVYSCQNGVIDMGERGPKACPACSKNKLVGPGTHFKVPMPTSKESPQNNIDAVKVIPAEKTSLDYCTERSTEIWDEIFYDCVGYGGDDTKDQAVNEKQVRAGFESKQNILVGLKENLEQSVKFVIETMARYRHGESFKSCTINLGTDFYLKSTSDAVTEYKDAKGAGVPQYFITHKRNQIDSISTRGNEIDAERLHILKHLEPWLDISLSEAKNLGFNETSREQFLLKADFSRLILKFESEYGSIVEFGSMVDFKIKIERIYKTLINYVKSEIIQSSQQGNQSAQSSGQGNNGQQSAQAQGSR